MSGLEFCMHCWQEVTIGQLRCPRCGSKLEPDSRPYDEKLLAALHHPLPAVRVRICWLLGLCGKQTAVDALMHQIDADEDDFVRKEAINALGHLHDSRALPLLGTIAHQENIFLQRAAENAIANIQRIPGIEIEE